MKKELKTQITRERIIEAALAEFGERGYKGFVINELCKKYSISKGVLYHNFAGKEELYTECVRKSFQEAIQFIKGGDSIPTLQEYMKRRHRFFIERPDHSKIFFEAWLCPAIDLSDSVREEKKLFEGFNRQVCAALIDASELKSGIGREEAMEYLSFIQEIFRSYFYAKRGKAGSPEEAAREYEAVLSKALHRMIYGVLKDEA